MMNLDSIKFLGIFENLSDAIEKYHQYIRDQLEVDQHVIDRVMREIKTSFRDYYTNEFYDEDFNDHLYVMIEKQSVLK